MGVNENLTSTDLENSDGCPAQLETFFDSFVVVETVIFTMQNQLHQGVKSRSRL
jgi:hypothetical protein